MKSFIARVFIYREGKRIYAYFKNVSAASLGEAKTAMNVWCKVHLKGIKSEVEIEQI